ncbi:MAG: GNAT family protein [Proteobacteria bacterium]|nr:GNAT family protein [Pseudomonadota bacterium]
MHQTESTIHTNRLDLVLMTPAFFHAALQDDRVLAEQILGFAVAHEWWPVSVHKQLRLQQVDANPALEPWMERAIVRRSSQTVVGSIAFHMAAAPDPVRPLGPGGVEMGYTIFSPHRRQGYASEACQALMIWAQTQGVSRFVLSISPLNEPSVRIAERLGFHKIGTQVDEDDGLEDIYELCIS